MNIITADFLCSNTDPKKCPAANKPEFAFIGRSNVGKSSLINMITSRKGLAKTSGTPGKTQLINHFLINEAWYLVDLPGYGFAKTSKTNLEKWEKMIRSYLLQRENLLCTFVLIDSRIKPQQIDMEFLQWMGENELPFALIFTKTDKLTKNELASNLSAYKKKLLDYWEELPALFITSAENSFGKTEVLNYLDTVIPLFNPA